MRKKLVNMRERAHKRWKEGGREGGREDLLCSKLGELLVVTELVHHALVHGDAVVHKVDLTRKRKMAVLLRLDKLKQGREDSLNAFVNGVLVFSGELGREGVEPGLDDGSPSKDLGLDVDHAASANRSRRGHLKIDVCVRE